MKPALPALLLGLLASTAALNVNRRDALKGTTASLQSRSRRRRWRKSRAAPAPPEPCYVPKMGIVAWAWGDSLFWSSEHAEINHVDVLFRADRAGRPGTLLTRTFDFRTGYDPKEDAELEKVFSFVARARTALWTAQLMGLGERRRGAIRAGPRRLSRSYPVAHEPRRRRKACEVQKGSVGTWALSMHLANDLLGRPRRLLRQGLGQGRGRIQLRSSSGHAAPISAAHSLDGDVRLSGSPVRELEWSEADVRRPRHKSTSCVGVFGGCVGKYSPGGPAAAKKLAESFFSQPASAELLPSPSPPVPKTRRALRRRKPATGVDQGPPCPSRLGPRTAKRLS